MNDYEITVLVTVSVRAMTEERAKEIAQDWVGVTSNAPRTIEFICAEVQQ